MLRHCLQAVHSIPGHRLLLQLLPAALGQYAATPTCRAEAAGRGGMQQQQQPPPQQLGPPQSLGGAAHSTRGQLQVTRRLSTAPQAASGMLTQLLGDNQFASGGLFLMALGAAAAVARMLLDAGWRAAWRQLVVTAEIDSRDDAYRWIMHWMAQHSTIRDSRAVSVTTAMSAFGTSAVPGAAALSDATGPQVHYLPAPGDHVMHYQGCWVWVRRQRASGNPQLAANARLLMETLHLTLFTNNRHLLEQLLAEAAAAYASSTRNRTVVHSVDADGYWTQVGSRPIRPLGTVVLPHGQAHSLLTDCLEFLASEEWYAHHGIPYRRGYLLFGVPGSGKTSLVMALAGALGLDIYVVTLSSPAMSDETLRSLLNAAGPRSLLLLEDVDAAFVERSADSASARLTFSGLLNAIDGVAAQEGRLLFMTTNHIERLAPALIRPGRVDVRYEFGAATQQQAHDLFVGFYADMPPAAAPGGQTAVQAQPPRSQTAGLAEASAQLAADVDAADDKQLQQQMSPASATDGAQQQQQQQQGEDKVRGWVSKEELLVLAKRFAAALPLADEPAAVATPVTPPSPLEADSSSTEQQGCITAAAGAGISMAAVQGHLMSYKRDPWAAVANAGRLAGCTTASAAAGSAAGPAASATKVAATAST